MRESNRHDDLEADAADVPSPATTLEGSDPSDASPHGDVAPSEAFQKLANGVRIAVLVQLYHAERDGDSARTFADIQDLVGSDSSARFAYHVRQLDGHFVRKTPNGYVLTPAGQRAAKAVLSGTFTSNDTRQAS